MKRRRLGKESGNNVHIIIRSVAGTELCTVARTSNSMAAELKDHVARELGMFLFAFALITADGSNFEGPVMLSQYLVVDGTLELTMIKRNIPRASSSKFLRVQSTAPEHEEPTFHGVQKASSRIAFYKYLRNFIAGFLMLCFIALFIFAGLVDIGMTGDALVAFLLFAFPWILYISYLIEAWQCETHNALRHLSDVNKLVTYIDEVKRSRPVPRIRAECYHYRERCNHTGGNGGVFELICCLVNCLCPSKRVSQSVTWPLLAAGWQDQSGDLVEGAASYPLLHIHFDLVCDPGDEETNQEHERLRGALRVHVQGIDKYQEFSEFVCLNGNPSGGLSITEMLLCTSEEKPPWLGVKLYRLASLLGLSWPYRWWFAQCTIKGDFVFKKKVWCRSRDTAES